MKTGKLPYLEDGENLDTSKVSENQVFFSTDYEESGKHKTNLNEPNWGIWTRNNNLFGRYVYSNEQRLSNGKPVFISDEDILISKTSVFLITLVFPPFS